MQFKGFSEKTVQYLHDVKANNSKIWYEEHKDDYNNYVKQPFYDLVDDLTPTVREIDNLIVTEPKRCLSHIYRDVRFVRDKTFYRDSAWITFRRPRAGSLEGVAYFIEIMSSGFRWGFAPSYDSSPKFSAAMRAFINRESDFFVSAMSTVDKAELCVVSDNYKRLPSGITEKAVSLGLEKWYQIKYFYISSPIYPHNVSYSSEIVEKIKNSFKISAPFYKLILEIEALQIAEDSDVPTNKRDSFEW